MFRQAKWDEPLIFELGASGRTGFKIPEVEEDIKRVVGEFKIPEKIARQNKPNIPSLSEVEVIRHYTRLSQMSYGVDLGPVPLGSCTMKYNPKIALKYAFHEKLQYLHPLIDGDLVQGLLELLYRLERWLEAITGMDYCSIHPAAGAQGELVGALIIRKYHELRGNIEFKRELIVPDSAHGTNPATGTMAGFKVVEVPTGDDGNIDINALKAVIGSQIAGLMITNPSTLGLFDERILEVVDAIHSIDGLVYYDGANLNGLIGYARPGDMDIDIVHLNLHKTFSAPHGGGGPGSGPVCVKKKHVVDNITLVDLVPGYRIIYENGYYRIDKGGPYSIGYVRSWLGNISQLIWAYVYIASLGAQGLREAGEVAVINTNYFTRRLLSETKYYSLPYGPWRYRKHESIVSVEPLKNETGVTAEDIAKGLLDAGYYAPTIYFPLIVKEALMVEFTESETKENIDSYINRLKELENMAFTNPEELKRMPRNTSTTRIDYVKANHPKTVTPTWRVKVLRDKGIISQL
ncbi:MAG: aminomethyl-transferring glycine dehydrogenase subunit GcvPB [Acidilobaceae archaeon]